ncbi:MAG: DNA polymerase ligase N-terminal domain-containing protein [Spirochaetota bacterium]|nr:DNA polymerase ligase N-terminal domain-containing protein [Spirochaetota bacterium]
MKFVIHHHTNGTDHYDIMIEYSNILLTWQVPFDKIKLLLNGIRIEAIRIQDHRKKYLNYEGPISCNRGRIEIFDYGNYKASVIDEDNIKAQLYGKVFKGLINIKKIDGVIYWLEFLPDPI